MAGLKSEGTDSRRTALSPEKQALLTRRLRGESGERGPGTSISRREGTGPVPLSFGQQRLWFLDRLEKESSTYNVPYAYRLRGALDAARLRDALSEIVRRHEALRTRFTDAGGGLLQEVAPAGPVPLPVEDLTGLPGEEREQEAMRRAAEEAHRGFDLERGPLFRCRLLRLSLSDNILLLTFHHIVFDGWSHGIFVRELRALYGEREAGLPQVLPDPVLQYADYAVWQRGALESESSAKRLSYWTGNLAGAPPLLDIPTDFPRPAVQGYEGNERTLPVPPELLRALEDLSRTGRVTLFMTLLTAFYVLLHRYTAQDDIVVGTPISGRNHLETEGVIGFFVNTLALRTDCSGEPTFRELLMRVRSVVLGAFENQEIPFERVVEAMHPDRHASFSPLFQVLFVLQRLGEPFESLGALGVTDVRPPLQRAKFDVTLSVMETRKGMTLGVEYRADLFEDSTMENLLRRFVILIRSIVAAPDERISALGMTDAAGEKEALDLGRGPRLQFPSDQTYQEAFESRVRETPGAVALRSAAERVTYAELNARSNRIAHALRGKGVQPDDVVAVWMDRCIDLPAAFLGVLKSGGAFLPLDPSYPAERLAYMMEDAAPAATVTLRKFLPALSPGKGKVICVDDDRTAAHGPAAEDPVRVSGPDNLAYVIYTSGSTGRPKGVEITHRSMLNHNFGVAGAHGLSPADRVLQFYSPSFDAAIEDIFPTWIAGAALVMRPEDIVANMTRFLEFVASEEITVLRVSTAYWHELAGTVKAETFPRSVRLVVMGGEKVRSDLVGTWMRVIGKRARVLSLYGPTEATVAATCCELSGDRRYGKAPIGRPLPNVDVYILDRALRPVPAGITGEICIGGTGVSRGYRRNPVLSAEKFVPDPYALRPGLRLYRSGDMGRFLNDGNIDFTGRNDAQVKVRGYRIEPGEIESALAAHPRVRRSVVKPAVDGSGNTILAAYVVLTGESADPAVDVADIGRWLAGRLPVYMIPQAIIPLDAIPLLPNGKTDLNALPPPRSAAGAHTESYAPPRDALESRLAAIWEEVLGTSRIGIYDNFFALGGHSLLAARLFGLIERRMGKNLPLATLLQAPTIDAFAARLRAGGWEAPWSSLVPIKPAGTKPPLYCVHALGGNVIGYTSLAMSLPDDQPVYGLQAAGLDGKEHPASTVEEMAAHYVKEIRAFQPSGPYYLGGACTGGIVAYEIARQLTGQGERIGLLAMFDTFAHSYARSLSKEDLREFKKKSRHDRVVYHATNLLLRPGRITYVRKKLRTVRRRVKTRLWNVIYKRYSQLRVPLPPALQKVEQYHVLAIKNYNPGPYPGRVTLFPPRTHSIGEFEDREQGWGKLALGGVEIHEVDGDHLTMLADPQVKVVASELAECLRRAYAGGESLKGTNGIAG